MKRKPKLDKNINKDVVLCETTNQKASKCTAELLMQSSIPFTRNTKRIPFFKREQYKGADEVWVISINRNEYTKARRMIDQLDLRYKKRLLLNVI